MIKKCLLALGLGGFACAVVVADVAVAAPASGTVSAASDQAARDVIRKLSSKAQVDSVKPSPLPGFVEVIASGRLTYISTDGKYLIDGNLIDVSAMQDLSEAAWAGFRKDQVAKVPASERIIYAPANPKYTVTVFTDVNCSFCRTLHEHMDDFNKAGIAVEYLAWPREGLTTTAGRPTPTFTEMTSIWCASDRKEAFAAAVKGKKPAAATCNSPVKDHFNLGLKLGVNGTPAIYGPNGRQLGGYLTPEQLLKALQKGG